MKNKKGFTLIELLAVIVILAIIALIATPIILNVIENAKKSAAKDSAYGYIDAIEKNNLLSEFDMDNKYQIIEDGEDLDINTLEVDVKGSTPTGGTITIEEGLVTEAELCINNYKVKYNGQVAEIDGKCNGTIEYKKYENGTAIYYNPIEGKICTDYKEENSKTGITTGCMKFYTFNDDKNSSTVNMILDHNTTTKIAWASLEDYIEAGGKEEEYGENGNNNKGPLTVTKGLNKDTEKWKNKARLISADEIAKITGNNSWNKASLFYFETNTPTAPSSYKGTYAWLYDNTEGCKSYGCEVEDLGTIGYWTSSTIISNSNLACGVLRNSRLDNYYVNHVGYYGIRPVITVSKKKIYTQYKEEILKGTDPVYSDNLIPVTIADNGTVTKADVTKEWYKYENKKWANAVILTDTGKIEEDGTIKEESIESYFVWIPRYKYKLFDLGNYDSYISEKPTTSNAKEIEIVFGTDTTSDSNAGECTTPGVSGETGNCAVGEYMTHPAFLSFNTNGIWVGKFETTGTIDNITIKPGIASLKNQSVKTMFDASYNYKRNSESHMMKNTEWGAVAYLSHSKYGINKEININNNSDFLTGYSATDSADQSIYPGTAGKDSNVTLPYNTETGYKASTTGNITGIYDMSGGAFDVMASYKDGSYGSSGYTTDPITNYIDGEKYFNKYNNSINMNSYNNRILGDGTGEIGPFYYYENVAESIMYRNGWYNDSSFMVDSNYPWISRGGDFDNGFLSGQFFFHRTGGNSYYSSSFRLVLTK